MRKIFAVILAAAVAIVGVIYFISGILNFITPLSNIPKGFNTGIATVQIIVGVISVVCLIGSITALIKVWDRNKANERALFSLGIFVLGNGICSLLLWLAFKDTAAPEVANGYLTSWIILFASGLLIFVASIDFISVSVRRVFGVLGTLVGIVIYSISCAGLAGNSDALSWVLTIGGIGVSFLGLILSVTLKDKKK